MARQFNNVEFPAPLHLAKEAGTGLKRSWKTLWLWKTSDGSSWELVKDFPVTWDDENGHRQRYVAKAGLITDMSSIPWYFQGLPGFQKAGRKVFASIIHDDIYEKRPPDWERKDADYLLYKGWLAARVNKIVARLGYRAVRLGGQKAWET